MGAIAVCAAASDFIDGPIAYRTRSADSFGRWLDNLADVVFVLTALGCEAAAEAIPAYIPVLIAASFAQYAIDSVVVSGSAIPVKSRLGHWGGVINYTMVILLAWAPPPRWPGMMLHDATPLIALFYVTAMCERALGYRHARAVHGSA